MRDRSPQRWVSAALSAVLLATNTLFAYGPEKSLWEERRRHARRGESHPLLLAGLPAAALPAVPPALSPSIPGPTHERLAGLGPEDARWLSLAGPAATLRRVVIPPSGTPAGLVLLLQDAHGNADAQSNISLAWTRLAKDPATGLLALEGAFAPIQLGAFREFQPREAVAKAADFLLKEKRIAGPIHAALTSPALPPVLGVDDEPAYRANVEAYRRSIAQTPGRRAELAAARAQLEAEKAGTYSPALLALDRAERDHARGSLGPYVRALRDAADPARGFPQTEAFLRALAMETSLDYAVVEAERTRFLAALSKRLDPSQIQDLTQHSLAHRSGALGYGAFYRYLHALCRSAGMDLSRYPALDAYVRYVLLADGLSGEALMEELGPLRRAAFARLARTPEERDLVSRSRRLDLDEKLLTFSLTPPEWAEYAAPSSSTRLMDSRLPHAGMTKERHAAPPMSSPNGSIGDPGLQPTLDSRSPHAGMTKERHVGVTSVGGVGMTREGHGGTLVGRDGGMTEPFEDFYRRAEARNDKMAENLLAAMEARGARRAVLVAGGFHTAAVARILAENDCAVVVMSPRIARLDDDGGESLSVFSREKTPLEKLFEGQKLFLAPEAWTGATQALTAFTGSASALFSGVETAAVQAFLGRILPPGSQVALDLTQSDKTTTFSLSGVPNSGPNAVQMIVTVDDQGRPVHINQKSVQALRREIWPKLTRLTRVLIRLEPYLPGRLVPRLEYELFKDLSTLDGETWVQRAAQILALHANKDLGQFALRLVGIAGITAAEANPRLILGPAYDPTVEQEEPKRANILAHALWNHLLPSTSLAARAGSSLPSPEFGREILSFLDDDGQARTTETLARVLVPAQAPADRTHMALVNDGLPQEFHVETGFMGRLLDETPLMLFNMAGIRRLTAQYATIASTPGVQLTHNAQKAQKLLKAQLKKRKPEDITANAEQTLWLALSKVFLHELGHYWFSRTAGYDNVLEHEIAAMTAAVLLGDPQTGLASILLASEDTGIHGRAAMTILDQLDDNFREKLDPLRASRPTGEEIRICISQARNQLLGEQNAALPSPSSVLLAWLSFLLMAGVGSPPANLFDGTALKPIRPPPAGPTPIAPFASEEDVLDRAPREILGLMRLRRVNRGDLGLAGRLMDEMSALFEDSGLLRGYYHNHVHNLLTVLAALQAAPHFGLSSPEDTKLIFTSALLHDFHLRTPPSPAVVDETIHQLGLFIGLEQTRGPPPSRPAPDSLGALLLAFHEPATAEALFPVLEAAIRYTDFPNPKTNPPDAVASKRSAALERVPEGERDTVERVGKLIAGADVVSGYALTQLALMNDLLDGLIQGEQLPGASLAGTYSFFFKRVLLEGENLNFLRSLPDIARASFVLNMASLAADTGNREDWRAVGPEILKELALGSVLDVLELVVPREPPESQPTPARPKKPRPVTQAVLKKDGVVLVGFERLTDKAFVSAPNGVYAALDPNDEDVIQIGPLDSLNRDGPAYPMIRQAGALFACAHPDGSLTVTTARGSTVYRQGTRPVHTPIEVAAYSWLHAPEPATGRPYDIAWDGPQFTVIHKGEVVLAGTFDHPGLAPGIKKARGVIGKVGFRFLTGAGEWIEVPWSALLRKEAGERILNRAFLGHLIGDIGEGMERVMIVGAWPSVRKGEPSNGHPEWIAVGLQSGHVYEVRRLKGDPLPGETQGMLGRLRVALTRHSTSPRATRATIPLGVRLAESFGRAWGRWIARPLENEDSLTRAERHAGVWGRWYVGHPWIESLFFGLLAVGAVLATQGMPFWPRMGMLAGVVLLFPLLHTFGNDWLAPYGKSVSSAKVLPMTVLLASGTALTFLGLHDFLPIEVLLSSETLSVSPTPVTAAGIGLWWGITAFLQQRLDRSREEGDVAEGPPPLPDFPESAMADRIHRDIEGLFDTLDGLRIWKLTPGPFATLIVRIPPFTEIRLDVTNARAFFGALSHARLNAAEARILLDRLNGAAHRLLGHIVCEAELRIRCYGQSDNDRERELVHAHSILYTISRLVGVLSIIAGNDPGENSVLTELKQSDETPLKSDDDQSFKNVLAELHPAWDQYWATIGYASIASSAWANVQPWFDRLANAENDQEQADYIYPLVLLISSYIHTSKALLGEPGVEPSSLEPLIRVVRRMYLHFGQDLDEDAAAAIFLGSVPPTRATIPLGVRLAESLGRAWGRWIARPLENEDSLTRAGRHAGVWGRWYVRNPWVVESLGLLGLGSFGLHLLLGAVFPGLSPLLAAVAPMLGAVFLFVGLHYALVPFALIPGLRRRFPGLAGLHERIANRYELDLSIGKILSVGAAFLVIGFLALSGVQEMAQGLELGAFFGPALPAAALFAAALPTAHLQHLLDRGGPRTPAIALALILALLFHPLNAPAVPNLQSSVSRALTAAGGGAGSGPLSPDVYAKLVRLLIEAHVSLTPENMDIFSFKEKAEAFKEAVVGVRGFSAPKGLMQWTSPHAGAWSESIVEERRAQVASALAALDGVFGALGKTPSDLLGGSFAALTSFDLSDRALAIFEGLDAHPLHLSCPNARLRVWMAGGSLYAQRLGRDRILQLAEGAWMIRLNDESEPAAVLFVSQGRFCVVPLISGVSVHGRTGDMDQSHGPDAVLETLAGLMGGSTFSQLIWDRLTAEIGMLRRLHVRGSMDPRVQAALGAGEAGEMTGTLTPAELAGRRFLSALMVWRWLHRSLVPEESGTAAADRLLDALRDERTRAEYLKDLPDRLSGMRGINVPRLIAGMCHALGLAINFEHGEIDDKDQVLEAMGQVIDWYASRHEGTERILKALATVLLAGYGISNGQIGGLEAKATLAKQCEGVPDAREAVYLMLELIRLGGLGAHGALEQIFRRNPGLHEVMARDLAILAEETLWDRARFRLEIDGDGRWALPTFFKTLEPLLKGMAIALMSETAPQNPGAKGIHDPWLKILLSHFDRLQSRRAPALDQLPDMKQFLISPGSEKRDFPASAGNPAVVLTPDGRWLVWTHEADGFALRLGVDPSVSEDPIVRIPPVQSEWDLSSPIPWLRLLAGSDGRPPRIQVTPWGDIPIKVVVLKDEKRGGRATIPLGIRLFESLGRLSGAVRDGLKPLEWPGISDPDPTGVAAETSLDERAKAWGQWYVRNPWVESLFFGALSVLVIIATQGMPFPLRAGLLAGLVLAFPLLHLFGWNWLRENGYDVEVDGLKVLLVTIAIAIGVGASFEGLHDSVSLGGLSLFLLWGPIALLQGLVERDKAPEPAELADVQPSAEKAALTPAPTETPSDRAEEHPPEGGTSAEVVAFSRIGIKTEADRQLEETETRDLIAELVNILDSARSLAESPNRMNKASRANKIAKELAGRGQVLSQLPNFVSLVLSSWTPRSNVSVKSALDQLNSVLEPYGYWIFLLPKVGSLDRPGKGCLVAQILMRDKGHGRMIRIVEPLTAEELDWPDALPDIQGDFAFSVPAARRFLEKVVLPTLTGTFGSMEIKPADNAAFDFSAEARAEARRILSRDLEFMGDLKTGLEPLASGIPRELGLLVERVRRAAPDYALTIALIESDMPDLRPALRAVREGEVPWTVEAFLNRSPAPHLSFLRLVLILKREFERATPSSWTAVEVKNQLDRFLWPEVSKGRGAPGHDRSSVFDQMVIAYANKVFGQPPTAVMSVGAASWLPESRFHTLALAGWLERGLALTAMLAAVAWLGGGPWEGVLGAMGDLALQGWSDGTMGQKLIAALGAAAVFWAPHALILLPFRPAPATPKAAFLFSRPLLWLTLGTLAAGYLVLEFGLWGGAGSLAALAGLGVVTWDHFQADRRWVGQTESRARSDAERLMAAFPETGPVGVEGIGGPDFRAGLSSPIYRRAFADRLRAPAFDARGNGRTGEAALLAAAGLGGAIPGRLQVVTPENLSDVPRWAALAHRFREETGKPFAAAFVPAEGVTAAEIEAAAAESGAYIHPRSAGTKGAVDILELNRAYTAWTATIRPSGEFHPAIDLADLLLPPAADRTWSTIDSHLRDLLSAAMPPVTLRDLENVLKTLRLLRRQA